MAQGVLPFQYEVEKRDGGMTGVAGLPLYVEFAHVMGLPRLIEQHVRGRSGSQGWTDEQMIMALVWLNLMGGDCVDDLRALEGDEGFCRVVRDLEHFGRTRSERRALKRMWRKKQTRTFPSPTVAREYLELFHNTEQEGLRREHEAFIPEHSALLSALVRLNGSFVAAVQRRSPQKTATLDMDATLVETHKKDALYCYKKFKAYQPLNVYWAEQGLVLFSEFRDGNVPAGYGLLRSFKEALGLAPVGVKKVYLRSDSAAYVHELLRYCSEGSNKRFGVIEFAVGADVSDSLRLAIREVPETDWQSLKRVVDGREEETGQQWGEVCFVPNALAHKKNGPAYRYLAIREPIAQQVLSPLEDQISLPFPTMNWGPVKYKITGIVTNREMAGDEVIWWYRGRCGKSEEAHSVMKEDLAGGKLPSKLFGANAAWWQIMLLSFNLNSAMKRLVLGETWVNRRLKAIRFWLIKIPGRVLRHARSLIVRLVGGHPSNEILRGSRGRMLRLCDSS